MQRVFLWKMENAKGLSLGNAKELNIFNLENEMVFSFRSWIWTAIVHRWEFEDLWIPECFLNRILKVYRSMGFRVDKMVYGFSDKMVSFATSVVKL
ncbi:uncharacterized protein OCT59_006462 [Rhizophagus irregularis]|uniref:uncharacterized protein n=1 Tax=Rhizophagus irregularis TaxID=588596 RepID=UPI00332C14F3|nr:hypothetical protein OCT59_006462 [Rhizophagus irregularis]